MSTFCDGMLRLVQFPRRCKFTYLVIAHQHPLTYAPPLRSHVSTHSPTDAPTCTHAQTQTPVYVYEEKCVSCSGTGFVRRHSGSSRNGRGRAGLNKCLVCTGLGYVRLTTTRYEPDVPMDPQGGTQFSVGRTLPASEIKQTPKFDPMGPAAD
eukprot:scaffold234252_cov19-Tisochrysis_lutea.AAC.1